jgi:hypothetical protein
MISGEDIEAMIGAEYWTPPEKGDGWQLIETAPKEDGVLHVRGLWVYSSLTGDPIYFDACAGYLEDGDFLKSDGEDYGWRHDDYTHWMPLPAPPKVTE